METNKSQIGKTLAGQNAGKDKDGVALQAIALTSFERPLPSRNSMVVGTAADPAENPALYPPGGRHTRVQ